MKSMKKELLTYTYIVIQNNNILFLTMYKYTVRYIEMQFFESFSHVLHRRKQVSQI